MRRRTNMPLVSVITPVFNAVEFRPEALRSVQSQTLPDWEHILVDDGSTDGSVELIKGAVATDSRLRLLRTQGRSGPGKARNQGLEWARGKYVAFLDADDLWLPQKLKHCVAWMKSNNYSFIYHDYRHISRDGNKTGGLITGPDRLDLQELHIRRGVGCLTVVINLQELSDFQFPVEHNDLNEDFVAWFRLLKKGHLGHRLPEDLGRYRLSETSRNGNRIASAVACWRIYRDESKLSLGSAGAGQARQGSQDCQTHPEALGCQQTPRPSPGTKTPAPSLEQLPTSIPVITPISSEAAGEGGKPATAKAPFQPEPPPPPTEFQLMVADSVGKMLPIYGASLFRQPPSTFAPVENVPVPADYVIGPGDELYVRLWGQLNVELRVTVDRNGQVFVPKVGPISVAGVHVSQLDAHFRQQIERIFRNFDLTVTLGKLRSIDVFFVGEARRPGTYTISSLSTLVNAIFAAGGPAPQGSMRHIQLKRDGQIITEFDLYDLLSKGDKSKDMALLPGDVIYVPPAGPQVAVAGSVNTTSIYELKDGKTSLADVIELAGGLNTVADGSKATVERIDQRQIRSVTEFSLDAKGQQEMVKDGDIVRILSIVPRFENAVTLRGNVANPGRYPWHAGMKIRDLLPNKDMLLT